MASNRSKVQQASAETPANALAAVARHGARIQIAAFAATGTAFALWAHAADRLAQALGDALIRRVDGETDSRELIVSVASSTSAHLRDLTALPSVVTDNFDTRLGRRSIDT